MPKYRPGNGSEGDVFLDQFCHRCVKYDDCEILLMSMCFDVDEPEYPEEWQETDTGPTCTAFESE